MKALSLLQAPAGCALQGTLFLGDGMGGRWDRLARVPLPGPALVVSWLWDLGGAFQSPLLCLVPLSRGAASGEG